jgi:ribonucleoside-diphosphate reductase alpha chain
MVKKTGDSERGLHFTRYFSRASEDPLLTQFPAGKIDYERRTAIVEEADKDDPRKRVVVYRQENVEVPRQWSQLATNIVAGKYFYGDLAIPGDREDSTKLLVRRVARFIAGSGLKQGYFSSPQQAQIFQDELEVLAINQFASFNSPVWFNAGVWDSYRERTGKHPRTGSRGHFRYDTTKGRTVEIPKGEMMKYPQASACFIQRVKDEMDDIMALAAKEAALFKLGSGSGTDLSSLRSSREKLSGGGTPSGPLSFLRVYNEIAQVVQSGGKTRRAAKMNTLRVIHPDIKEFIEAKTIEEKKAQALQKEGYSGGLNGDAYRTVAFQNANLSVRLSDDFMRAATAGEIWTTREVTTGKPSVSYPAKDLLGKIAEGTWYCGDPGVQYEDTINRWHTCKNDGTINSSNPCSEFMFLDDSACNLASLNLLKFLNTDGSFDISSFQRAASTVLLAQEILVDSANYPSKVIAEKSHKYRPLGLGYANLGALLMARGLPYDSEEGRAYAGAITSLMTSTAYRTSSEIAETRGAFERFGANKESMLEVIAMHQRASEAMKLEALPEKDRAIAMAAKDNWALSMQKGKKTGFRNAQVTVLAPTGTIGFMMDCDTTGIEPDIALVKYKQLAGGGKMRIINQTVPAALKTLGYDPKTIEGIIGHIDKEDTIEGAPGLQPQHLPIFDCAFPPAQGIEKRSIPWQAHLRMMAAVQPFLSGAISKTVNMTEQSTVEDIVNAYTMGHELGLKAVAIYRDGSKWAQPVTTTSAGKSGLETEVATVETQPVRKRLPSTRLSLTKKFTIGMGENAHEGYMTLGMGDDGKLRELFVTMGAEGSTVNGWADAWATAVSLCLQYGVPLEALVRKFEHMRFAPAGLVPPEKTRGVLDQLVQGPHTTPSPVSYIMKYSQAAFPNGSWIGSPPKLLAEGIKKPEETPHLEEVHEEGRADIPSSPNGSGLTCPTCHGPAKPKDRCGSTICLDPNCGAVIIKSCGES